MAGGADHVLRGEAIGAIARSAAEIGHLALGLPIRPLREKAGDHAVADLEFADACADRFHHPCAIRMNLALPRALVEEAFNRLSAYVFV